MFKLVYNLVFKFSLYLNHLHLSHQRFHLLHFPPLYSRPTHVIFIKTKKITLYQNQIQTKSKKSKHLTKKSLWWAFPSATLLQWPAGKGATTITVAPTTTRQIRWITNGITIVRKTKLLLTYNTTNAL